MNEPEWKLFATLWSLRDYPSAKHPWSWKRKIVEIRRAGFDGFMAPYSGAMAPPPSVLKGRGNLEYLAITSLGSLAQVRPAFQEALKFDPVAFAVQLCDHDTPISKSLSIAIALAEESKRTGLPVAIEVHRDTCTETPEKTWALADAFRRATGEELPICFDFSHFAIVKHLAPPYWPRLGERADLIRHARQFHLRPFNGHHCQIPATRDGKCRTPEYRDWLEFAGEFFRFRHTNAKETGWAVIELGNTMYSLSCFPDVWTDARVVLNDLRECIRDSRRRLDKDKPAQATLRSRVR